MKFKNNIILGLSALLFFFSCSDDDIYETDPARAVYDNYYQSESEFESAIQGVYSTFWRNTIEPERGGFYNEENSIIKMGDVLADNLILDPVGRRTNRTSHVWAYNPSTVTSDLYTSGYLMISRANSILDNIDNLNDEEELEKKKQYKAEALALRALAAFEIARMYIKIPTQSSDANSFVGIAYPETYDPEALHSRLPTVAETYQKIMTDLEASYAEIPSSIGVGRLNKNAVAAMIAKVALYMGDYSKVISYATPVVDAISPAKQSDLEGLWRSQNSKGVIFEVVASDVSYPTIGINYSQGNGNSMIPEYTVDKDFYSLFDGNTEPERRNAYFRVVNPKDGQKIVVNKYIIGDLQLGLNNGRYIRVEEVILNLAEAQYLSGQGDPLATLNILRDARYSSYVGGESGIALFDAIQLERRKELAFESGDRWYTLKRLQGVSGIPTVYTQGVIRSGNGYLADGTGQTSGAQTLPPNSPKWQFPIAQFHMDRNPNMTQTPGY